LEKLLQRSMWHLHREGGRVRPEVRAKIVVIPGDLLASSCGVSAPQRRRLAREVDYVIHCAASISFNEHIHSLLASNYEARALLTDSIFILKRVCLLSTCCAVQATHNLANLAAGMGKLRAFVHLSSAYVNCDQPRGSHVEERLYPMDWGRCSRSGEAYTVESLAAELRSLPAEAASRQVCLLFVPRGTPCGDVMQLH
jgi:fatty acyl-CoA reductase